MYDANLWPIISTKQLVTSGNFINISASTSLLGKGDWMFGIVKMKLEDLTTGEILVPDKYADAGFTTADSEWYQLIKRYAGGCKNYSLTPAQGSLGFAVEPGHDIRLSFVYGEYYALKYDPSYASLCSSGFLSRVTITEPLRFEAIESYKYVKRYY